MSVTSFTETGSGIRYWPVARTIGNAVLAVVVFLSGFVIIEPSPYELAMVAVIVGWAVVGLRFNRYHLPLIVLLGLFIAGGLLAITQAGDLANVPKYVAISAFLAASSVFYAAVIARDPETRFRVIEKAYLASALIVAAFGSVAYFEVFPGADFFKYGGRATSTFQDPNVFGPFLALPLAVLTHRILTRPPASSLWNFVMFANIALAVLLAFSRAAWGLALVVVTITAVLTYITRCRFRERLRAVWYLIALMVALGTLLTAVIATPAIGDLFEQRARLVQYYDEGQSGRFGRVFEGFSKVPEMPLGMGAHQFARQYGADEHNTVLKGFTAYGWLGGASYVALIVWTLIAAFPLLFRTRPWQPLIQAAYAVFVGHMVIQMVIDIDHWRHVFLIIGLLWGAISVEGMARWRERAAAARSIPAATGVPAGASAPPARTR